MAPFLVKSRALKSMSTAFMMCLLVACLTMLACSRPAEKQAATFTLETGVTVTEQTDCFPPEQSALSMQETANRVYEINLTDIFDCDARVEPYLTEAVDKKATLVLTLKGRNGGGFNSSCECGRRLSVRVADRLEPGDVLYVLNDSRVIGHLPVPQK